jgi:hypothetical protein
MENETEGTALDAINEALGVTEAVEDEEAAETEEPEPKGEEGDADEEGDEESEEESDEEGEGEPTAEEKAAQVAKGERNADGTFKKPEVKKPDPVNDPIPKDLKQETSDRMRALVKIAKEKDAEVVQVRTDFDTIINGIKASGSTPEQYGEAISWLSLFNSPKVEDRKAAYNLVNEVADRMATLLGIDRAAADPLAAHLDLKAALANKQITPELARETARYRDAAAFKGQIETGQRQQQQTQAQAQAEHEQAKEDLNAFDAEQRNKDPLYDAKRKMIVPILQPLFKTIPKSQWAQAYKDAYARVRVQPRGVVSKPGQQPLRGGKNPAGGQVRQATSAMEAMNGALASIKR